MRRLIGALLAALLLPAAALGQETDIEGEEIGIEGRSISAEGRVIGVEGRTVALEYSDVTIAFRVIDIVFPGDKISGEVEDLVIKESDTEIRIELSANVLFDFDKANIKQEAAAALTRVADVIRDHPKRPVRIEGHTNSKGADKYNQRLSEARAKSVRDWLIKIEKLDGKKYQVKGLGETKPVASNEKDDGSDDPEGRQKNRRVEIVIGK